jgi:hypothetical protein
MDQITRNPRSHDEGTSAWRFAHQRLSQMLIERVEPFGPLVLIMKLDAAGARSPWLPGLSSDRKAVRA